MSFISLESTVWTRSRCSFIVVDTMSKPNLQPQWHAQDFGMAGCEQFKMNQEINKLFFKYREHIHNYPKNGDPLGITLFCFFLLVQDSTVQYGNVVYVHTWISHGFAQKKI